MLKIIGHTSLIQNDHSSKKEHNFDCFFFSQTFLMCSTILFFAILLKSIKFVTYHIN